MDQEKTVAQTRATQSPSVVWVLALGVLLALVGLYWSIAPRLVRQWASDDDYTHGFLILPLALYFVWERRAVLKALPVKPSLWGAGLLALGLLMSRRGFCGRGALPATLLVHRGAGRSGVAHSWRGVPARAGLSPRLPDLHGAAARDRDERGGVPTAALRGADRHVLHADGRDPGAARGERDPAREHDARGGRGVQRDPLPAGAPRARGRVRLLHAEGRLEEVGAGAALGADRDRGQRVPRGGDGVPGALLGQRDGAGLLPRVRGLDGVRGGVRAAARGAGRCSRGSRMGGPPDEALALRARGRADGGGLGAARFAVGGGGCAQPKAVRGVAAGARRMAGPGPEDGRAGARPAEAERLRDARLRPAGVGGARPRAPSTGRTRQAAAPVFSTSVTTGARGRAPRTTRPRTAFPEAGGSSSRRRR